MKKLISFAAAAVISCSAVCMTAYAEDAAETKVYVTISDGKSSTPVLIQKEVSVTDIDNDGKLTINDALYITHENNFSGGAAAGYASGESSYGVLMLNKLWGIENGGGYGFYLDNNFSMGLTDTIADGNYIYAFVYTDLQGWSDSYSWFDKNTVDAKQGDELDLTLSHISFDASGSPVSQPVDGAVITIDGEATEFKTDAEGKVKVKLDKAGNSLISAKSDSMTLVPPVLSAVVSAAEAETTTTAEQTTTSETTTETTTSSDTTTTASDTTTASNTTSSSGTSSTTTAKTTTTASKNSKNDSPKTGDTGAGAAVFILGTAVCTAFALKKNNEK